LLAYPVLLEPWLRLTTPGASVLPPRLLPISQSTLWTMGYALFAVLAVGCGVLAMKRLAPATAPTVYTPLAPPGLPASPTPPAPQRARPAPPRNGRAARAPPPAPAPAAPPPAPPALKNRLAWIALAFVPSSLMLGVTQYLSTDIASIPLLWIVPLTIYLLTFI